jgi:hypothetical protein
MALIDKYEGTVGGDREHATARRKEVTDEITKK